MTGLPYMLRVIGYGGMRGPKTRVRGSDVAGRVEAVGNNVTTLRPGDEVYGVAEGSFAEYAVASADKLAPKPANLTHPQAAAVPISGLTALQAVRDRRDVRPGQHVLVIGASGGVGTFAVQIAKAFGAHVTGVCSTTKVDLVRSLGADDVIDYTREDITGRGQRYDVILDNGGHRSLTPPAARPHPARDAGHRRRRDRRTVARRLRPFAPCAVAVRVRRPDVGRTRQLGERARTSSSLTELIESGKVTPVIDRTYPLSETPAAVQHMVDGQARGKVVVTV